jgi:DNA replication and repair protein RecF
MTVPRPAHLRRLKLYHFRNLGVQELSFPTEGVAIIGDNAQGKSNLLEAIYYLETFRSFRGGRDDQLIAFGQPLFRVAGTFDRAEADAEAEVGADAEARADDLRASLEIAAAYAREGKRKKVTVDGAEPDRLGDAIGRAAAVTFSPSDVAIVSEGPAERRRFLDIVLSLNRPGYLAALQRYRSVLNQRNAALRANAPPGAVSAWDDGLVAAGSVVFRERRRWIERWGGAFSAYYADIGGGQAAAMTYAPNVPLRSGEATRAAGGAGSAAAGDGTGGGNGEDSGAFRPGAPDAGAEAEAFRAALTESGDRERRLGTTVVGPHRDEVVFTVDEGEGGREIRDFGSGGQRRTAALCVRLVEAATIREARGREPIVLMDDVFAELDPGRSERVLKLIDREETGQVILTAPKEADIRVRGGDLPRWTIRGGILTTG